MRKAFRPSSLGVLESRIALSTVAAGLVPTEVVKLDDHHDHTPKDADHVVHEGEHVEHRDHATK